MGSIAVGALNVSEHGRLDESDVRAKIATEDGQVAQLAVAGADGRRRRHLVAAHAQMAVQILLKLVTEMAIGTFDQGLVSFRVGLDGQGSRIFPIRDSAIFLDERDEVGLCAARVVPAQMLQQNFPRLISPMADPANDSIVLPVITCGFRRWDKKRRKRTIQIKTGSSNQSNSTRDFPIFIILS